MINSGVSPSCFGLEKHGISQATEVLWNLPSGVLVDAAIRRGEGILSVNGALVVHTGAHTGRAPKDKYIVRRRDTEGSIDWGSVNQPMRPEAFDDLLRAAIDFTADRTLYAQDLYAGADENHRVLIRVVTQRAWQSLFARQLFVRPPTESLPTHQPEFFVLCLPDVKASPELHGTRSETAIVLDIERRIILICGTEYAGEIKKSIFTTLNYLLPAAGVMPMHCSANVGAAGDTALFFGLSGTGKTTLSADPTRRLIGDDEHGWSDTGVFNFEGGSYAKCINLTSANEPQIWDAVKFGTVLENVAMNSVTGVLDFASDAITENTRAAYPLDHIPSAIIPSVGGHPDTIFFLTCDAFGVLPPISRLTPAQAMYHFLSGYTAKVAGTEAGVTEPQTTFSACFGAPFLPRHPSVYAKLLGEKLERHRSATWLVNTGWSGGPPGVGARMSIDYTRRIIQAALQGHLDSSEYRTHPVFGLSVPLECPGVPKSVLWPSDAWANPGEYAEAALDLARRFADNFRQFEQGASAVITAARPVLD